MRTPAAQEAEDLRAYLLMGDGVKLRSHADQVVNVVNVVNMIQPIPLKKKKAHSLLSLPYL